MEARTVKDSQVYMTELVLPNDTNQLGNLLGGRLMHWIDIAAAIAAARHSNRVCVTASVDELNFHTPIKLGEIVVLQASVNCAFTTSMEVGVMVTAQNLRQGTVRRANNAYLTFVAIDDTGLPVAVPPVQAETPDERRRYVEAQRRREARLARRNVR
ncbi:MAG: acyl-CoA thioesterase [Bacteroidetes bacterium]|nr:acyl-CoA thioesterase [Bacteroidota bacterium]MCW5896284.1 acyl-CoA thioesterase [Bacteroidota bacterium]